MSISKRLEPMSELPKCKICGNYPVNYHAGEFGIKHHCVDKHCTLCNVLFTSDQWRTLMGEPDGFVLVPAELTAENGAKAALMGEFSVPFPVRCPDCDGGEYVELPTDYCGTCNNTGQVNHNINVPWVTIKEIWKKAVEVVKQ